MIYISRTSKLLAARNDITTPHLLIETIIVTGSTSRLAACNPFGYRVKKKCDFTGCNCRVQIVLEYYFIIMPNLWLSKLHVSTLKRIWHRIQSSTFGRNTLNQPFRTTISFALKTEA